MRNGRPKIYNDKIAMELYIILKKLNLVSFKLKCSMYGHNFMIL